MASRQANRSAFVLASAFVPMIRVAILVASTTILLVGGMRALDGQLAAGTFSVLVCIVQRLLWPLTWRGEVALQAGG